MTFPGACIQLGPHRSKLRIRVQLDHGSVKAVCQSIRIISLQFRYIVRGLSPCLADLSRENRVRSSTIRLSHRMEYYPQWQSLRKWAKQLQYTKRMLLSLHALYIFDVFRAQIGEAFLNDLKEHNISVVNVLPWCTDKVQSMKLAVQKVIMDKMRAAFMSWYASKIKKHLESG